METAHQASRKRPLVHDSLPETPRASACPSTPSGSSRTLHSETSQSHELWSGAKTVANKAVGRAANLAAQSSSTHASPLAGGSPYAHAVRYADEENVTRPLRQPLMLDYDETASKAIKRRKGRLPMRFGNRLLDEAIEAKGVRMQGIPMCVEILGASGSGKTHALLHLVAKTALPSTFASDASDVVSIGGSSAGVIFFCMGSTPSQIVPPLVKIMFEIATEAWAAWGGGGSEVPVEWVDSLVDQSLARIHMVECTGSLQFLCSMRNIPNLLKCAPSISCLVFDSLSAFHWMDKVDHLTSAHEQSTRLLNAAFATLDKTASEHNLAIFGTRWMVQNTGRKGLEPLGRELGASERWRQLCSHRVILSCGPFGHGHDGSSRAHWAQALGPNGKMGPAFSISPFATSW